MTDQGITRENFLKIAGIATVATLLPACVPTSPENNITSDISLDNLIHGYTPQSWNEMANNPNKLVNTIALTSFELSKQYLANTFNDPEINNLKTYVTTSKQQFIKLVREYKNQVQLSDQDIESLATRSNAVVLPLYSLDKTTVNDQIIILQANQITSGVNFKEPLTPETINLISLLFLQDSFHEIFHVLGRPKFNFSNDQSDQILNILDTLDVQNLTDNQYSKILQVFSQHGIELIIQAKNTQTQEAENIPIFYYLEEARNALIRDHFLSPKNRLLLNDNDRELAELMRFTLKEFLSITNLDEWYEKNSQLAFPDLINWYREKSKSSNYHLEVRDVAALLGKLSTNIDKVFLIKTDVNQQINNLELAKNNLLNSFKPWEKNN